MKIQPLADRLVVKVLESQEEKTRAVSMFPILLRKNRRLAEVLAVGPEL